MNNDFKHCQYCGFESSDICEFRMWQKCADNGKPIVDEILIICQKPACQKRLDDDPTLYNEMPWAAGGPGKFMLLCGDCHYRQGYTCKHPHLKANGGNGLEVKFTPTVLSQATIHYTDGSCRRSGLHPATFCEGNPSRR